MSHDSDIITAKRDNFKSLNPAGKGAHTLRVIYIQEQCRIGLGRKPPLIKHFTLHTVSYNLHKLWATEPAWWWSGWGIFIADDLWVINMQGKTRAPVPPGWSVLLRESESRITKRPLHGESGLGPLATACSWGTTTENHPAPCLHSVPRESTAGTFTLPRPKEHNSWHAVGSPCPFLPFEIGLFHAFMRFKFTISNYYHQLSLASFTSPCMCLYINMCTHMFYIYTWYIHVCTYAHIRKCTYTHKYIIRTYVFQLLHMYLFGRMVSLHCCIFLFGNLL